MPFRIGIRHLSRQHADWLRARIHRDISFYHRLYERLRVGHFRDDDTHEAMHRCGLVEHYLITFSWAVKCAGAG